jgi:hypothetical protein
MSGIGAMAPPCQKTAREYDINRKCVRNWYEKYEELKAPESILRGKRARKMHDLSPFVQYYLINQFHQLTPQGVRYLVHQGMPPRPYPIPY